MRSRPFCSTKKEEGLNFRVGCLDRGEAWTEHRKGRNRSKKEHYSLGKGERKEKLDI